MTDATQHAPRDEELARLGEQVLAQQARIVELVKRLNIQGSHAAYEEDCELCKFLATTDDTVALQQHDDKVWNSALTRGIEWQATRGHTLDADDYENELRSLKR